MQAPELFGPSEASREEKAGRVVAYRKRRRLQSEPAGSPPGGGRGASPRSGRAAPCTRAVPGCVGAGCAGCRARPSAEPLPPRGGTPSRRGPPSLAPVKPPPMPLSSKPMSSSLTPSVGPVHTPGGRPVGLERSTLGFTHTIRRGMVTSEPEELGTTVSAMPLSSRSAVAWACPAARLARSLFLARFAEMMSVAGCRQSIWLVSTTPRRAEGSPRRGGCCSARRGSRGSPPARRPRPASSPAR